MEELKKNPDIKIVAQQPADYRQPQAVTVVSNILQSHPEPIDPTRSKPPCQFQTIASV
jgi:ABC-type sugar transport system substrate-binding protein